MNLFLKNKIRFLVWVSWMLNGVLLAIIISHLWESGVRSSIVQGKFGLLFPGIAQIEYEEFAQQQKYTKINYQPLRELILLNIKEYNDIFVSIYFEDLYSGSWIGLNEREKFKLASLLKVPLVAAVLKMEENDYISLSRKVFIESRDLNDKSGSLYLKGSGYELTIRQLIEYTLIESDNTAASALERIVPRHYIFDAIVAMGIPLTANVEGNFLHVSARDYSNILRSLYFSSYLRRRNSQLILDLLAKTIYKEGLPAGVPAPLIVAHKMGYWTEGSYYLDCGIVYVPHVPYIFCMMLKGGTMQSQQKLISNISYIVYQFISNYE
ncbi:MAG: serine hydrolase [Deltaproteobacteria bacterium]|nr:serine hydrolase [Deltaproteobacteria bacterium]